MTRAECVSCTDEVERPLPKMYVRDEASTLFGSSEVHCQDERNVQEETEARAREEDGEVNQPLPSLRPPSTHGTDEMGGTAVVEEEEVTSVHSPETSLSGSHAS